MAHSYSSSIQKQELYKDYLNLQVINTKIHTTTGLTGLQNVIVNKNVNFRLSYIHTIGYGYLRKASPYLKTTNATTTTKPPMGKKKGTKEDLKR